MEHIQLRLAGLETAPSLAMLSLLGTLCGLATGIIILLLHWAIHLSQGHVLQWLATPGFVHLNLYERVGLPISGALLLGLFYQVIKRSWREGGIVHVIERTAYYQGILPVANAVIQFGGSVVAIAFGESVGREGVSAHLGATAGSFIARRAGLPNSSVRTLVGCGVAAGIAASFNSPLSGVVFAMEVVMMEYTIAGFAPIILAAVSATAILHLLSNTQPDVVVTSARLGNLLELPYLVFCGAIVGVTSALFSRLTSALAGPLRARPVWLRMLAAGIITAACAVLFPQVMGVGFDIINAALAAKFALGVAAGIAFTKIVATSAAMATSLPGGLIVPTLLIGACLGEALGIVGGFLNPQHASSPGFYALLGMGAMMGAVLQAPLTGMIMIVELSSSTQAIFPAMLIVITAMLVAREAFDVQPEFVHLLRQRGMDYRNDPVAQFLRRVSVGGAMDRQFVSVASRVGRENAVNLLQRKPRWLLVRQDSSRVALMRAADLVRFLNENEAEVAEGGKLVEEIELVRIPGPRLEAASIHLRATLQEAYDRLEATGAEALYVERQTRHGRTTTYGVLTRQAIENTYQP